MFKKIRKKIIETLQSILKRRGFAVVKWTHQSYDHSLVLPEKGREYLVPDNPELIALIELYQKQNSTLTNSEVWNWSDGGLGSKVLRTFRGDRAYVWQLKGVDLPELRYLTSTYFQLVNDPMNLLNIFSDDELFGNYLFSIAGRKISRELLDSANEINFIERNLKLSEIANLKILDIGAGYGRMAHRCSEAFANLARYYCTDGVPVSAFICAYYLKFRKVGNAEVVTMPVLSQRLAGEKIHLALNIHSFSECSLESIDWWINTISNLDIPYLMIVPNAFEDSGARLLTNSRKDFISIVEKYGYSLRVKEPKYRDPLVQKLGLYPSFYYLFERHSRHSFKRGLS